MKFNNHGYVFIYKVYIVIYYIYVYVYAVDLNSFICKRPFFANKKYVCESFANPTFIFRRGLMLKLFVKSFAKKTRLSQTQKITFARSHVRTARSHVRTARSHVRTLAAFVMDNLYMDL